MADDRGGARCAAFIGPFGAGKTTLVRALAGRGENVQGDLGAKAGPSRRRYVRCDYLGERWTLVDCPGSVEFLQQTMDALIGADVAVVVVEARPDAAITAMPYLRAAGEAGVPCVLFVNRVDQAEAPVGAIVDAYREVFPCPLFLRQFPLLDGGVVAGSVDLISNRAFAFREGGPSEAGEVPEAAREEVGAARQALLENLADFDDALLERLLEDEEPSPDDVFRIGSGAFAEARYAPALIGSAARGNGVTRLFKALRHDAPGPAAAAARHGLADGEAPCASVTGTLHLAHVGRVSVLRVWRGELAPSDTLAGQRLAGLAFFDGISTAKLGGAGPGDLVALTRSEGMETGQAVGPEGPVEGAVHRGWHPLDPVYSLKVEVESRDDDVKLGTALGRLVQEDASLVMGHAEEGGIVLSGQGEMHIRDIAERLAKEYDLKVGTGPVGASWRETITRPADIHARHKKQTGGAGQFADVKVRVAPTERGSGFRFANRISGGVVPRQYVPAVEAGLREALARGPLGFPVVDVEAALYDGQHHSVDSSEMAFKTAGRMAMADALAQGGAVLLEPVHKVAFETPSAFSSKLNAVISSRRGQILGFDSLKGVAGWDEVQAMLPEAAIADIILEVRALTQGVARFRHGFDHYQELRGREAEGVVEARRQEVGSA